MEREESAAQAPAESTQPPPDEVAAYISSEPAGQGPGDAPAGSVADEIPAVSPPGDAVQDTSATDDAQAPSEAPPEVTAHF